MKVIPLDLITDVTASSENANYPAVNLLNDYPKKTWRGTGFVETLTFQIGGGISSAFAIFNTNATGISFALEDPNKIEWESGVDWEDGVSWYFITPTLTEITSLDGDSGSALVEWDEINGNLELTVSLVNNSGETLYAGVGKAGKLYSYNGPDYGFTESIDDLSIIAENSNGSVYIKDRDSLRVFKMDANMLLETSFHEFIFSVARIIKRNPAAWIVTDIDNSRWLVYARFTNMPAGKHFTLNRTRMSFEITEVL